MDSRGPIATETSVRAPGLLRRFLEGINLPELTRDGVSTWCWRLLD